MFPHGVRNIIPHSSFVNSERRRGRRPKGTCPAWWELLLASACWALAKNKANCLEGNTMSNRGAYSTKERMPSDIRQGLYSSAWKAVPDWWCTALQAVVGIGAISPAHPRFSRMYGVTNSTVFQTVLYLRNLKLYLYKRNLNYENST